MKRLKRMSQLGMGTWKRGLLWSCGYKPFRYASFKYRIQYRMNKLSSHVCCTCTIQSLNKLSCMLHMYHVLEYTFTCLHTWTTTVLVYLPLWWGMTTCDIEAYMVWAHGCTGTDQAHAYLQVLTKHMHTCVFWCTHKCECQHAGGAFYEYIYIYIYIYIYTHTHIHTYIYKIKHTYLHRRW